MLQEVNGTIQEIPPVYNGTVTTGNLQVGSCVPLSDYGSTWQTMWYSYPVYVCTDKTKKAIEILKALQADKQIKCDSVPRFIALVEKIAAIL